MAETAPAKEFKPYIPDSAVVPEFTFRAVLFGMIFGIIFGAVTVYVGLRAGLTVSASIPIAVLSISLLRALGKASILENNLVQTIGSAGESVAGGVIFTMPALIFLGFELEYSRILLLALIGGWLGVLFMIPLRSQLIVQEHGNLLYPEGTACADVLIAGEKGGSFASRVFWGLGLGGAVHDVPERERARDPEPELPTYNAARWYPGAALRAAITSEYLGVGYIIGPKIAGVIFAGGVFSWLVMMPAIKFFGSLVPTAIYPSTIPIAAMDSGQLWNFYIRYIGAGAVAAAGLITLGEDAADDHRRAEGGRRGPAQGEDGRRHRHRPHLARPQDDGRARRLGRDRRADVGDADLQADRGRAHRHAREPAGVAAGRRLRLPVRDGVVAAGRPHRHLVEPDLGHGDRDPHGHLRRVPRGRLDLRRLRRAGAHDRRRRLHRGRERRQHLAGPEDGLPGRRDALGAADGALPGRPHLVVRHRPDAARREQGPREVRAGRHRGGRREPAGRREGAGQRLRVQGQDVLPAERRSARR